MKIFHIASIKGDIGDAATHSGTLLFKMLVENYDSR